MFKACCKSVIFISLFGWMIFGLLSIEFKPSVQMIIFNSGGVEQIDHGALIGLITKRWSVLEVEAEEILRQWLATQHGEGIQEKYWENYATARNKKMPENWVWEFQLAWENSVSPIPGILPLVQHLQMQNYKVALISHSSTPYAEILSKMGHYRISLPIFFSKNINDFVGFKELLKKLFISPHACLFIDNNPDRLAIARKFGVNTVYYVSLSQLCEEFEKRGISCAYNQSAPASILE